MFYAALDVSLRSVAVCIIDDEGKVRLERSVPSDVPDLVRCLNEFGEPIHQVGLEAGTLTQHLTYGLREAGFEVVCMEARQVNAALSAMRNKTDKHDARGIAQILRSGWYGAPRAEGPRCRTEHNVPRRRQRCWYDPARSNWDRPAQKTAVVQAIATN